MAWVTLNGTYNYSNQTYVTAQPAAYSPGNHLLSFSKNGSPVCSVNADLTKLHLRDGGPTARPDRRGATGLTGATGAAGPEATARSQRHSRRGRADGTGRNNRSHGRAGSCRHDRNRLAQPERRGLQVPFGLTGPAGVAGGDWSSRLPGAAGSSRGSHRRHRRDWADRRGWSRRNGGAHWPDGSRGAVGATGAAGAAGEPPAQWDLPAQPG